jgi:hypothetical protein
MAELMTYSPEDVTVLFGGVHTLSGFVDGTFISISKDAPSFATRVSSSGMVSRVRTPDNVYTVGITLHSSSESNQVLSYALILDESTKMAKFPLIIKDHMGSSLFFSPVSWIETRPASDFSIGIEDREWTIKCANATFNVGGNTSESSLGVDALNTSLGLIGNFL